MSNDWLETLLMGVIFFVAVLFAIRHFLPGIYQSGRHLFLQKNVGGIDVVDMSKTSGIACQTKCSTCNGCDLANNA